MRTRSLAAFFISFLAASAAWLIILASCTPPTEEPKPRPTVPVDTSTLEAAEKPDPESKSLPTVCYDAGKINTRKWPLDKAVKMWNKNGKVLLEKVHPDCKRIVIIHTVDRIAKDLWGEYEEFHNGVHRVTLSNETTEEYRITFLVHELGHALGLDHILNRRSIMYKNPEVFKPTERDLQNVRSVWSNE